MASHGSSRPTPRLKERTRAVAASRGLMDLFKNGPLGTYPMGKPVTFNLEFTSSLEGKQE